MALTKIKLDTMVTGNLPDANIPNNITISNAGTATALETARTIHGVSFDGTANIDLTEAIQDVVGGMVSSNTETNIAVTYDDTNGKLDFASTDTNTTYSVGDGGLTQNNFTDALKSKLDGIASSANNYSLPLATSSARGGVKIGYSENGKNYPVELDSEKMYVNVPWTDTNTTYSVGDGGLTQNNFTNTLKSKLDGIESGATADQDLSGYATLSGATFSGAVTFDASPVFSTGASGTLASRDGFSDFIGYNASYGSYIGGGVGNAVRYLYAGGYFYDGSAQRTLLHSGNVGYWVNDNRNFWFTTPTNTNGQGFGLQRNDGTFQLQLYGDNSAQGFLTAQWASWDLRKYINGQLNIRVSGSYYDVWHAGNDGSSSGLDADTVDGYHGSNYIGKNGNSYYRPNTWINMVDSGTAGLYWSGGNGAGWHIYPLTVGSIYMRSGNSSYCEVRLNANGTDRGMIYADSSNQVGLLDEGGNWALKKQSGGQLYIYGDGGTTQIGSGDEWGRLEFSGHTNGIYVYGSHGNFRVDGAHWCTYDDGELDLGSSQTSQRWRNLYLSNQIVGGFGGMSTGGTTNWNDSSNARSGAGYTLLLGNASNGPSGTGDYFHSHSYEYNTKTGGGNMCQFAIPYIVGNGGGMYMRSRYDSSWGGWVKFYDSNNMGYLTNSSNTYGTFNVQGGGNSWSGITYSTHSSKPTIMFKHNHGDGGLYHQGSSSWRWYYDQNNGCIGLNGSTTNSSYGAYVTGSTYTTGSYGSSDIRFKENIETIDNGLDKVMKMRGVYFDWNDEHKEEKGDSRQVGVIAQEIRTVLPEVVMHQDNDEYAVDYSKITAVLIESVKELKNEINQLKEGCCHGS